MRYVRARFETEQRELAYRIYVTDSLMYSPQSKYLTKRYIDFIKPIDIDDRTGDEVALDVISKIGLQFSNNERGD